MTRAALAWGPAVLWAAAIFWASSRPTVPLPSGWGTDKLAHFGAYTVLGFLLARGTAASRLSAGWAVVLGVLYGASDEVHQHFVPGRSVEVGDWVADALGVVAGVLLSSWLASSRRASGALVKP